MQFHVRTDEVILDTAGGVNSATAIPPEATHVLLFPNGVDYTLRFGGASMAAPASQQDGIPIRTAWAPFEIPLSRQNGTHYRLRSNAAATGARCFLIFTKRV